jgi:hypothetical protein
LKIDKEVKIRFDRVDRDFKYILQQSIDSKVLQFLKISNIKNLLESMLNLLATTKKSLNNFLEVNLFVIITIDLLLLDTITKLYNIIHRINGRFFQDFTFSVMKIY